MCFIKQVKLTYKFLFFALSLQSYYFYELRMPLFSVISFGLLLLAFLLDCIKYKKFKKIRFTCNKVSIIFLGLFIWSLLGLLFSLEHPEIKRVFAFLILVLAPFISQSMFERVNIKKILEFSIFIHIFFFFLQFFSYYILGYRLDFLFPLTGEEQRIILKVTSYLILIKLPVVQDCLSSQAHMQLLWLLCLPCMVGIMIATIKVSIFFGDLYFHWC